MRMRCVCDSLLKVYMLRMSCVCAAFVLRMSCVCPAYVTPCSRLALQEVDNKNLEYEITVLEETLRQKEPNMSAIKEYMIKVLIVYFCFFLFSFSDISEKQVDTSYRYKRNLKFCKNTTSFLLTPYYRSFTIVFNFSFTFSL